METTCNKEACTPLKKAKSESFHVRKFMKEFMEDYGETIALLIAFTGICMTFYKVGVAISNIQFF